MGGGYRSSEPALLAPAVVARLATCGETVRLRAGDVLFREGDAGASFFLVEAGRLEVFLESGSEPTSIRFLPAGGVIGELALLCGAPRNASVRAVRDSSVREVCAEDFWRLLDTDDALVRSVVRVLAHKLASPPPAPRVPGPPSVVAVVGIDDDAPVDRLARALVATRVGAFDEVVDRPSGADEEGAWGALV